MLTSLHANNTSAIQIAENTCFTSAQSTLKSISITFRGTLKDSSLLYLPYKEQIVSLFTEASISDLHQPLSTETDVFSKPLTFDQHQSLSSEFLLKESASVLGRVGMRSM